MELKEAIEILPTIKEYFQVFDIDTEQITLDGTFTVKQLEAIITVFRHGRSGEFHVID